MKRYQSFLGKRVEARYRGGSIYHSANGVLTSDNGSTVVIEEQFVQNGKKKMLRVEIPYECILTLIELLKEGSEHP